MNNTSDATQALAQQFGAQSARVWEILVAQQTTNALITSTQLLLFTVGALWFYWYSQRKWIDHDVPIDDNATNLFTYVAYVIMGLLLIVGFIVEVPNIIIALTNPEYRAIKMVLGALSNHR